MEPETRAPSAGCSQLRLQKAGLLTRVLLTWGAKAPQEKKAEVPAGCVLCFVAEAIEAGIQIQKTGAVSTQAHTTGKPLLQPPKCGVAGMCRHTHPAFLEVLLKEEGRLSPKVVTLLCEMYKSKDTVENNEELKELKESW